MSEPWVFGNRALISAEHDELVKALADVRDRFAGRVTPQELAIVTAGIDLLYFLHNFATKALMDSHGPFTVDSYLNELVCSGGLELIDGHLIPKMG